MPDFEIRRIDDSLVLFEDAQPVTAPDGTPLWSRAGQLMDDILRDAELFGTDPGAYPSLLCLQLSYLAFAVPQSVEQLAGGIMPVLERLAESRFPGAIDEMYLIEMVSSAQSVLANSSKRALMAVTVAWQHLGSPTSGIRLIDAQDDPSLTAMARGLCDRCCTWLGEAIAAAAAEAEIATWPGEWREEELERWAALFPDACSVPRLPVDQSFPGESPRFRPQHMDDAFCEEQCCAPPLLASEVDFAERCAMHRVLRGLRRFAETPEE